jgi:uncharacterized protein YacL (UPF0231 family)
MLTTISYELRKHYEIITDKLNDRIRDNLEKKKKILKKIDYLDVQNEILTKRTLNEKKNILEFVEHQIKRYENLINNYNEINNKSKSLVNVIHDMNKLKKNIQYMLLILLYRSGNARFLDFNLKIENMKKYNLQKNVDFNETINVWKNNNKFSSDEDFKFAYFDFLSKILCENKKFIEDSKKQNRKILQDLLILKCLSILTIIMIERHDKSKFIDNYQQIYESIGRQIEIINQTRNNSINIL